MDCTGLFAFQVKTIHWIGICVVICVYRSSFHRVSRDKASQLRHIASNPHLDHARGQFGPSLLPAEPAVTAGRSFHRSAKLFEFEFGGWVYRRGSEAGCRNDIAVKG